MIYIGDGKRLMPPTFPNEASNHCPFQRLFARDASCHDVSSPAPRHARSLSSCSQLRSHDFRREDSCFVGYCRSDRKEQHVIHTAPNCSCKGKAEKNIHFT